MLELLEQQKRLTRNQKKIDLPLVQNSCRRQSVVLSAGW